MLKNRFKYFLSQGGFFVFLAVVPLFTQDPFHILILNWLCFNILLGVGLRLIMTVGEVNFAHGGFVGIGAYTSALLVMRGNISFWLALPSAGVMAGIVAIAFGCVTLKLKGAYFFLATFAFGEVIRIIFHNTFIGLFGGSVGLLGIPAPSPILNISFGPTRGVPFFYVVFIVTAISLAILYRIEFSPYGKIFRGIREADGLAASIGIHIMKYKLFVFVIGCFFAGIVGSLYAHMNAVIAPDDFTYNLSILVVTYVVVGGSTDFVGPILGALVLTEIGEMVRQYTYFETILFGMAIIAVMLFAPGGLSGIFNRLFEMRFIGGKMKV